MANPFVLGAPGPSPTRRESPTYKQPTPQQAGERVRWVPCLDQCQAPTTGGRIATLPIQPVQPPFRIG